VRAAKLKIHNVVRNFFGIGWGGIPGINYIDFDRGLRERNDLKSVVYENIQDLKKRQIINWIDIDKIWLNHQRSIGNYADALTSLASLEINLKQSKASTSKNI
jgi:hypothetical protein